MALSDIHPENVFETDYKKSRINIIRALLLAMLGKGTLYFVPNMHRFDSEFTAYDLDDVVVRKTYGHMSAAYMQKQQGAQG